ncbi:MAG: DedA family protein [Bacteroidales bacterium]|nr:DedA family protein [Bacteroidales bacterium]
MDTLLDFLIAYGNIGMFVAAFLAGSILPLASEGVLLGLLAAGGNKEELLLFATLGNVLGAILSYYLGALGKVEWISRYLGVSAERLDKGVAAVRRYGVWTGVLSWVPLVGDLFPVALGYVRAPLGWTLLFIALGKFLRYAAIVYGFAIVAN